MVEHYLQEKTTSAYMKTIFHILMVCHSCRILYPVTSSKTTLKDWVCFHSTSQSGPIFLFPFFFFSLTLKLIKMAMPRALLCEHEPVQDTEMCSSDDVSVAVQGHRQVQQDIRISPAVHFRNSSDCCFNFQNKENTVFLRSNIMP